MFKVREEVGDVTVLVNNAGIVTGKKFLNLEDRLIEKTFQVNTLAHFWVLFIKNELLSHKLYNDDISFGFYKDC